MKNSNQKQVRATTKGRWWVIGILFLVGAIGMLIGESHANELENRCFPMIALVDYQEGNPNEVGLCYTFTTPRRSEDQMEEGQDVEVQFAYGSDFLQALEAYENRLNQLVDGNHLKVFVLATKVLEDKKAYNEMMETLWQEVDKFPRNATVCVMNNPKELLEFDASLSEDTGGYLEQFLQTQQKRQGIEGISLGQLMNEYKNQQKIQKVPKIKMSGSSLSLDGTVSVKPDTHQKEIAKKILRFHVRANSDSKEDQELKKKVRDAVGSYMAGVLEGVEALAQTKDLVQQHLPAIEEVAQQTIRAQGYSYPVQAKLSVTTFPEKTYGAYTFPPGEYEALEVDIGEGQGRNWWCVLFPNMCFQGSVYEEPSEEAEGKLREVLSPEEYKIVFSKGKLKIRLKFLDRLLERA